MATVVSVPATGNPEIDGLLGGTRWSGGVVTYSFADSPSDYVANYGFGEPTDPSFSQIPATLQVAINYAVTLIAGYTNATIQFAGSDAADIMVAQSSVPDPHLGLTFQIPLSRKAVTSGSERPTTIS